MIAKKNQSKHFKYLTPYLIPVLTGLIILFLGFVDSTASLTRIDPEYVCLLNGLNVSTLQFGNIGFTDSPGTPFLVVSGILIRIVHLFFGKGAIVDDVVLRPDFYIQVSSLVLLLFSLFLFIWGGKKILHSTKSIFATVAIQSSLLLSPICLTLQVRYNMDRLIPLLVFVFAVYTILYLYNSISSKKYAVISGIIMGIGFITKFNFIVLTIIPIFILMSYKDWLRYIGAFTVSAFISFLPIIDKFQNVKRFISRLLFYEGSYGQGKEGVFNLNLFSGLFNKVPALNISFTFLLLISVIIVLIYLFNRKRKKEDFKKIAFLFGFVVASFFVIILVSKNFKNYYLAPVLSLSGIVLFLLWKLIMGNWKPNKTVKVLIGFLFVTALTIPTFIKIKSEITLKKNRLKDKVETAAFIENNIKDDDYIFLEPTWMSGVMIEDGLMYGLSYVADKNDFSDVYLKYYPNVLSYEGDYKPIKHFRTKDAKIDRIFTKQNTVFLYSTPRRKTEKLKKELTRQANLVNVKTKFDTVFINQKNKDMFIKVSFNKLYDLNKLPVKTHSFFNNMEENRVDWKQNALVNEKSFSGAFSSKIQHGNKYSSTFQIDLEEENYEQITAVIISSKYFQTNNKNSARLMIEVTNKKNELLKYPVFCTDYFDIINEWGDFYYKIYLPKKYRDAQKINIYFYNSSKHSVFIDDILIDLHS